jgi:hypothetical protein
VAERTKQKMTRGKCVRQYHPNGAYRFGIAGTTVREAQVDKGIRHPVTTMVSRGLIVVGVHGQVQAQVQGAEVSQVRHTAVQGVAEHNRVITTLVRTAVDSQEVKRRQVISVV